MDRSSAAETVELRSIPGRIKAKTINWFLQYSFFALRSALNVDYEAFIECVGQVAA